MVRKRWRIALNGGSRSANVQKKLMPAQMRALAEMTHESQGNQRDIESNPDTSVHIGAVHCNYIHTMRVLNFFSCFQARVVVEIFDRAAENICHSF